MAAKASNRDWRWLRPNPRARLRLMRIRRKMRRRRRFPVRPMIACFLIALLCAAAARFEPQRLPLSGLFIDTTIWLRGQLFAPSEPKLRPDEAAVVVVALDETTLATKPFSDVPRVLHNRFLAEAARKALDHEAKVVAFDMVFAFQAPRDDEVLSAAIRAYEAPFEELLLAERRTGRIILATTADTQPADRYARLFTRPLGLGFAETRLDGDGVMRRVPAFLNADDDQRRVPTLSGLVRDRMGSWPPTHTVAADDGRDWSDLAPVQLAPPFPILDLPHITLADLMACRDEEALTALLRDRAVFFGGALKIEDQVTTADRFLPNRAMRPTPCAVTHLDAGLPGVFVHAAAVDGAVRGWAPDVVEAGDRRAVTAAFAIAFVAALGAIFLKPWSGAVITFVLLPAFFFIVRAIFLQEDEIIFAFAAPMLAAPTAFTLSLSVKTLFFDQDKRRLKKQFSKYLSDQVIEEMAASGEDPELGGAVQEITVMFVDLSGFTKFSERWQPDWDGSVMDVLNDYLTTISQTVGEHGGYVDKFIGDAVMAIWNAPRKKADHASPAIWAAKDIRRKVHQKTQHYRETNRYAADNEELFSFSVKIGIETGRAMVGNVGSPNRLEFSAIGDTVNLAARLEAASGRFGDGFLVGPNAARAVAAAQGPALLQLVRLQVKGRLSATTVHTPIGADNPAIVAAHEGALHDFEDGAFGSAERRWRELAGDQAPWAEGMAEIAEELAKNPPDDWNGVMRLTDK
ncbi:MAG: adenylate/guanylate cyclase domain-containing protein [Pseudomonadota bacterium]